MAVKPRAALVTGGSGAIGAAIIERLRRRGISCLSLDLKNPSRGSDAIHVRADLSDAEATRRVLSDVVATWEVLWLANNAGIVEPASLDEATLGEFGAVVAVNLRAALQCAQAVIPGMRAAGFGRIVNVSSRAALGKERRTSYAAAKAGLLGMTRTWALELGPAGITVNAVGPGPIDTDLFRASNPDEDPRTREIIDAVPVRRLGTPQDVAHAIDFLLSDEASFITGQTLFVCGGLTVGSAGT